MNILKQIVPMRFEISNFMTPGVDTSIIQNNIGKVFTLHWHEFYEFEFAVKGNGIQKINGISYPFNAGSLIMLSPVDFHEVLSFDSSLRVYNLRFTYNIIDSVFIDLFISNYTPYVRRFQGQDYSRIMELFSNIDKESSLNDIYSRLTIKGYIDRLLTEIFRNTEQPTSFKNCDGFTQSPHIKKALFYIQNNFRDELNLEKVASFVHLSPHYFSKLFHTNTGYSFIEYLLDYRMKFAKSLLSGSSMSITDIAYSCGFNSPAHFTRMFTGLNGMSPKKFRSVTVLHESCPR